jgi:hypothetical protein
MGAATKYGPQPVRSIIAERGLSIMSIVKSSGLKQGHVYQAIEGRISPSQRLRDFLVELLELPVEKLFTPESLVYRPEHQQHSDGPATVSSSPAERLARLESRLRWLEIELTELRKEVEGG